MKLNSNFNFFKKARVRPIWIEQAKMDLKFLK
jgi:hypothetical protein